MSKYPEMEMETRNTTEYFFSKLYSTCACKRKYHFRTDLPGCLETFQTYQEMNQTEKNYSLGALTRNMKTVANNKRCDCIRVTFDWKIDTVSICKEFFAMIHNSTSRQIERYQECIKKDTNFEDKRGGNNLISLHVYQNTRVFLDNYLKDIMLPNPQNEFLTLSSFICYKKMFDNLNSHYLHKI